MIYVVSGFFRSGTSMMMQALAVGGLPIYTDPARDAMIAATSGRLNPDRLYEPSGTDLQTPGFPRMHDGKAVKMFIPWLGRLAVHEYRVVLLHRDPAEIIQSYEQAFHESWDARLRGLWIANYEPWCEEAVRSLHNRRDVTDVRVVEFTALRTDPERTIRDLGWPVDAAHAASVVLPGAMVPG